MVELVVNLFTHRSSTDLNSIFEFSILLICIIVLNLGACREPTVGEGYIRDITDDLYHRLRAGIFEPENEPCVVRMVLPSGRVTPGALLRVSWEHGSFRVKSNQDALVVMYMDTEAILNHVRIENISTGSTMLLFMEHPTHPISFDKNRPVARFKD